MSSVGCSIWSGPGGKPWAGAFVRRYYHAGVTDTGVRKHACETFDNGAGRAGFVGDCSPKRIFQPIRWRGARGSDAGCGPLATCPRWQVWCSGRGYGRRVATRALEALYGYSLPSMAGGALQQAWPQLRRIMLSPGSFRCRLPRLSAAIQLFSIKSAVCRTTGVKPALGRVRGWRALRRIYPGYA